MKYRPSFPTKPFSIACKVSGVCRRLRRLVQPASTSIAAQTFTPAELSLLWHRDSGKGLTSCASCRSERRRQLMQIGANYVDTQRRRA